MPEFIHIEVTGIDKLIAGLNKFPQQIHKNMGAAGAEASKRVILVTPGLQKYPPPTAANQPPEPYYIRGRGTQTKSGNRGGSERLGTQFYTDAAGMNTTIGNRASYADYVVGEGQAHFMAPKGWRKLYEVAQEKTAQIVKVYQAWIDKTIRELGLG